MISPHSWKDNVPCFLKLDVDIYGMPDYYGWEEYYVLDEPIYSCVDMIAQTDMRQIHHYSRRDRFKMVLMQLIGWSGKVPKEVLYVCKHLKNDQHIWKNTRATLKACGYRKYYNRIPRILFLNGYQKMIKLSSEIYERILIRFQQLEYLFDQQTERKYFPSLRYVCFKLLQEEGLDHQYPIACIITYRKQVLLDSFWNKFFIC